jgi:hypothetical protein
MTSTRRSLLATMASFPVLAQVAGCAGVLRSSVNAADAGLDTNALKESVDGDQIKWAVRTEHFAISDPVSRTYPPVTLLVQGSPRAINLGSEMLPYTKLEDLQKFAGEHDIETAANAPTVWLYQWLEKAQGPMIFETGFVVQDGAQCPPNAHGYRIKRLASLKVCSIVYRGPHPSEPNSGWGQIRWAERAKSKGFEYDEKIYRELYVRDGGKKAKRPRITVVEISIA